MNGSVRKMESSSSQWNAKYKQRRGDGLLASSVDCIAAGKKKKGLNIILRKQTNPNLSVFSSKLSQNTKKG